MHRSLAHLLQHPFDEAQHAVLRQVIDQEVLRTQKNRQPVVGVVVVCDSAFVELLLADHPLHDVLVDVRLRTEFQAVVIEQHLRGVLHPHQFKLKPPCDDFVFEVRDDLVDLHGMWEPGFHQFSFLVPVTGTAAVASRPFFHITETHPQHDRVHSIGQRLVCPQDQSDNSALNFHNQYS